ncbi:MAG: SURF1 family protein [Acidipropionibacterium sp.]|jgi:cytochrome oxidase assembly protein ShyY1|nr:SURF1 family protein [Acidipropionibacterium sp.]
MSEPSSRPAPHSGRFSVRLSQILLIATGIVLAVVMTGLGLWQMNVFESQQANTAQARAGQPPVAWSGETPRREEAADLYGRRVQVSGTYLKQTQVLVGTSYPLRVVTGLRTTSGETIPVVRGQVSQTDSVSDPPAGEITVTGVLLPSDAQPSGMEGSGTEGSGMGSSEAGSSSVHMPAAVLPALRLEVLAQTWPEPLIPGYVTLSRQDAARERLPAATAPLPQTDGGARNRSYALQWWAFAAFALGMSIVFARTVGTRGGGSDSAH